MASSDINSVVIVGRLTRDVELKYMNNGNAVASMSIAVNRSKKEGDQWVSEAHFLMFHTSERAQRLLSHILQKESRLQFRVL